jgi:hypothetical protein
MSLLTASLLLYSRISMYLLPTCRVYIRQLIALFWAHKPHPLERSVCSRARSLRRQRMGLAYANDPIMLAHDRRVLDVSLEDRLLPRTSDLVAWAKTMIPVINQSVRDARTPLHTSSRHPCVIDPCSQVIPRNRRVQSLCVCTKQLGVRPYNIKTKIVPEVSPRTIE